MYDQSSYTEYELLLFVVSAITVLVIISSFIFDSRRKRREIERINSLSAEEKALELQKLTFEVSKYKTSHLLHLVISVFSFGGWAFIWLLISISNSSNRGRIQKLIDHI